MKPRNMILSSIGCALVLVLLAVWGILDVVWGEAGPEDLVLTIPFLVTSVAFAAIMLARLRQVNNTPSVVPPRVASALVERMWRYARWSRWSASLIILLSMVVWGVRSQSILVPALVGLLAVAATWISLAVFFRPRTRSK